MTWRRLLNPVSLVLYVFLYVVYDIVIVISSRFNTSFSFHPIVVIFGAEFLKFAVSLVMFSIEWCAHRNTARLAIPQNLARPMTLAFAVVDGAVKDDNCVGCCGAKGQRRRRRPQLRQQRGESRYEVTPAQSTSQLEFEQCGASLVGFQCLLPGTLARFAVRSFDGDCCSCGEGSSRQVWLWWGMFVVVVFVCICCSFRMKSRVCPYRS